MIEAMEQMLSYEFMRRAFGGILLLVPLFSLLGTLVVNQGLSFFSDALGHSALTGVGLGVLLGLSDQTPAMLLFAVLFALIMNVIRRSRLTSSDTVIGVFSSCGVALGLVLLSRGNYHGYQSLLIGDILSVTPLEIGLLALVLAAILLFWLIFNNRLTLAAVYPNLAASRGIPVEWTQAIFTTAIAVVVTLSISWVGLLILNSLLVLPGAAARNIERNIKEYHIFSVINAGIAGITGLILSYLWGVAAGASSALVLTLIYGVCFIFRKVRM